MLMMPLYGAHNMASSLGISSAKFAPPQPGVAGHPGASGEDELPQVTQAANHVVSISHGGCRAMPTRLGSDSKDQRGWRGFRRFADSIGKISAELRPGVLLHSGSRADRPCLGALTI